MQADTVVATSAACCRPSIATHLSQHRWLVSGIALALLVAGFVWQWSWLVAIGVAPLLISAAPCIAMCALGLCMHRATNHASTVQQDAPVARLTSGNPSPQQET